MTEKIEKFQIFSIIFRTKTEKFGKISENSASTHAFVFGLFRKVSGFFGIFRFFRKKPKKPENFRKRPKTNALVGAEFFGDFSNFGSKFFGFFPKNYRKKLKFFDFFRSFTECWMDGRPLFPTPPSPPSTCVHPAYSEVRTPSPSRWTSFMEDPYGQCPSVPRG